MTGGRLARWAIITVAGAFFGMLLLAEKIMQLIAWFAPSGCPQRIIFDGETIRFDLGTQSRALSGPVGTDAYVQPIRVPGGASPGPARYRVIINCNPLHRIWPLTKEIDVPFRIMALGRRRLSVWPSLVRKQVAA